MVKTLIWPIGCREADLVQHPLHDRLQPACADVLHPRIHIGRNLCNGVDGIGR